MKLETIIASLLILSGIACLAMSGTFLSGLNTRQYVETFIQLCIWMGIPLIIGGVVYFIMIKRRK